MLQCVQVCIAANVVFARLRRWDAWRSLKPLVLARTSCRLWVRSSREDVLSGNLHAVEQGERHYSHGFAISQSKLELA